MWNRLRHAFRGLGEALRSPEIRGHLVIAFGVVVVGFLACLTAVQWALVFFAIGLVLVSEIFNTAIEEFLNTDRVHPPSPTAAGSPAKEGAGASDFDELSRVAGLSTEALWAKVDVAERSGATGLPKELYTPTVRRAKDLAAAAVLVAALVAAIIGVLVFGVPVFSGALVHCLS